MTLEDFVSYEAYYSNVEILNGTENGTFELSIDTTDFLNLGVDPENKVIVSVNGNITEITTMGSIPISGDLNEEGYANVEITVHRKAPSVVENTVIVTLSSIDTNPALVDVLENEITITIPITI
jgi:hypothetical protein